MVKNKKFSLSKVWFLSLFVFASYLPSYSQTHFHATLGEGFQVLASDSSFSFKVIPHFQVQYEGNSNLDDKDWQEKLLIRRARLKFEGFIYDPALEYKIELGLSSREMSRGGEQNNFAPSILLEALAKWNFYKNFELLVGQTKLPGNRGNVISSQKLQFTDRSVMNAYFNLDRDIGIQLRNSFSIKNTVFRQIAAISTGEGKNVVTDNAGGRDYTFRIEVLPFGKFENNGDYIVTDLGREQTPKLAIGATYDLNKGASRMGGQTGNFLVAHADLHTIFIDGIFKYRGTSLMMEYAHKTTPDNPIAEWDEYGNVLYAFNIGKGINIQGGYLFKNDVEIAGRYSQVKPAVKTQKNDRKEFILAISKYIYGHSLKVQSDFSLVQEETQDDYFRLRVLLGINL